MCHAERSEASPFGDETLRYAQGDSRYAQGDTAVDIRHF